MLGMESQEPASLSLCIQLPAATMSQQPFPSERQGLWGLGRHLEGQVVLSQLPVNFSSQAQTQVCPLASTSRIVACFWWPKMPRHYPR